ncbi:MAG: hypothetical protein QNI92_13465 [Desulfobacterales bacterium]|nr:hypothetical protein [Desulfobacterales bacterium]MDJ0913981.1 hypothetical protein [Desulfobacterales bacterium]
MKTKRRSYLKAILIGFLFAKIAFTLCYLASAYSITDFLFHNSEAIAQDKSQVSKVDQKNQLPLKTSAETDKVYSSELSSRLFALEEKRQRLKKEENRLNAQRKQLEELKKEIEQKIGELAQIQQQIESTLERRQAAQTEVEQRQKLAQEAKIKRLVKVYTSMKPKTAAALIEKMDMDVVLKLFARMKGEQIGSILTYVNRDRAAKISELLAPKSSAG